MERAYVFIHNVDSAQYSADVLALRCFDDRFWKPYKHFLRSMGIVHMDPVSVDGGVKIVSSPEKETDRDLLVRQIEHSMAENSTRRIVLFSHHDCGAYGGIARFSGDDEEFAFHRKEHDRAKEIIANKFPKLSIESYFIDLDGVINLADREKKEYLIKFPAKRQLYVAEAFTLRCFDDRYWKSFKHYLRESKHVQHMDPSSVWGGAKILATPEKEDDRDFMLREIEKSLNVHRTKKAMLFTHRDCGAYGGSAKFNGDADKEFEFHVAEHIKAADVVSHRFPELLVENYYIDERGVVKVPFAA